MIVPMHTVRSDIAVHYSTRDTHKPMCGQKGTTQLGGGSRYIAVPVDLPASCKKCLEIVKR